jgi:protein tyrosine/serine phosphatase
MFLIKLRPEPARRFLGARMKTFILNSLRAAIRVAICLILVVAALAGSWAGYLQLTGNIHPVTKGMVYRSAQLNDDELAETIKQYHIKSVINLRGDSPGDKWYTDELKVTAAQGAVHYDIGMYAKREPNAATLKQIFDVLRNAPRPLLIHCNSGSDRSGLISAIYKYFIEGRPVEEAEAQLSFRFGHFPWLGSGTVAMDKTFQMLVLTREMSTGSR